MAAEFNGLSFDPSFESWKLLSTTDRGDNHSFRFILGNEVAVKAAQTGNISPWPDGARFAKIAWQQEMGPDGLVHPGKFIQVELMVKNAREYKDTEGWGWGRWRGLDLKPYGNDAHFVNECTGCHQPLRGNDYVYTMPITTARVSREEVANNAAAARWFGKPAISHWDGSWLSPCTSIPNAAPRRFSTATTRPCKRCRRRAPFRRIRQDRCWRWSPGHSATIPTGSVHAFPTGRCRWSSFSLADASLVTGAFLVRRSARRKAPPMQQSGPTSCSVLLRHTLSLPPFPPGRRLHALPARARWLVSPINLRSQAHLLTTAHPPLR